MDFIQKTRDDYNKIARHFARTRQGSWSEFNQFKSFIKDGQRVLDWGCGNGRLLLFLKELDISYFGVDQSQSLLKLAKKQFAESIKKGKAKFFCTAFKEKKFNDDYFDLVFMIASFHHLPDKKSRLKLLKKTYKEMKPGAYLLMTVWNLKSEWAKAKKDWKKLGENDFLVPWKNQGSVVEVERYYHHFEKSELKELLLDAGFDVLPFEEYNKDKDRNLIAVSQKPL